MKLFPNLLPTLCVLVLLDQAGTQSIGSKFGNSFIDHDSLTFLSEYKRNGADCTSACVQTRMGREPEPGWYRRRIPLSRADLFLYSILNFYEKFNTHFIHTCLFLENRIFSLPYGKESDIMVDAIRRIVRIRRCEQAEMWLPHNSAKNTISGSCKTSREIF